MMSDFLFIIILILWTALGIVVAFGMQRQLNKAHKDNADLRTENRELINALMTQAGKRPVFAAREHEKLPPDGGWMDTRRDEIMGIETE